MQNAEKIKAIACGLVLLMSGMLTTAVAQEDLFAPGFELGVGARALSMGGAYTALGGDYTASFWNPAGLTDIRRIEFSGSLRHALSQNDVGLQTNTTAFIPSSMTSEENFTRLNSIGLAYPIPTQRGSLVLSFGFNRVKSFDSIFDFRSFNVTANDSVNQAWKEIEGGGLDQWTLAGGIQVAPNMSVGLGVNFWTGGTDFESTFREVDILNLYTFDNYTVDQALDTDISGFNLKAGAMYHLGGLLSFGATISSPVTFKVDESFSSDSLEVDDDGFVTFEGASEGVFSYEIQSPWTYSAGAALNLLNLQIAGSIEYVDWSQVNYQSEPPFVDLTQSQANRIFDEEYRDVMRVRLGAEFTLPLTGISFRAGYFLDPAIYKDALDGENKQFLSAGVGFLLNKNVKLDAAFVHGFWKRYGSGLDGSPDIGDYVEDIKLNKVMLTLAFRM